jgi:hypothetical protein
MREYTHRTKYTRLTPELLATIPDTKLEQAILDFIEHKRTGTQDSQKECLRKLSPGFGAVYNTWLVEAEVYNGGFNQYFWNSGGELAPGAVAGFHLMGLESLARLMERAIEIEREDRAKSEKLKERRTLEAFSESYKENRLNELDRQFGDLATDLPSRRVKFIRAHPELFVDE